MLDIKFLKFVTAINDYVPVFTSVWLSLIDFPNYEKWMYLNWRGIFQKLLVWNFIFGISNKLPSTKLKLVKIMLSSLGYLLYNNIKPKESG